MLRLTADADFHMTRDEAIKAMVGMAGPVPLRLAADADFHGPLYRVLCSKQPGLDMVRIQDEGLRTASDPEVLEWAAAQGRILLSHDRQTMPKFAYDRVRAGLPMPGVFIIRNKPDQVGMMVEEILQVALRSEQDKWKDRVEFLPIR